MKSGQHLYIYNRKEMAILVLLGTVVAIFAFILGIHLGKRVPPPQHLAPGEPSLAASQPDQLPNAQEFKEQAAKAQQVAGESLNQALHDEVERTGARLDTPRQVDLPEKTHAEKTSGAAKTTGQTKPRMVSSGRFTLQIGSHPSEEDAKAQLAAMESAGLKPEVKPTDVRGIGMRYRVYIGSYETKEVAEKAGERLKAQHLLDSYIVSKTGE